MCVGVTASLGKRIAQAGLEGTATLGGLLRWPDWKPVRDRPKQIPPNFEASRASDSEPRAGEVVAQGHTAETRPALRESNPAPTMLERAQTAVTAQAPQSQLAPQLAELQAEKEILLSELDKARREAKEAAARANAMAADVALLQSELVVVRHQAEKSRDKRDKEEEEARSRLASQLRESQEVRDRLASDLEITQSSLQETIDRENALKTRVDALESHLTIALRDLEEARAEVEKLRSELADATSRSSLVTSDVSVEDKTFSPEFGEEPVGSTPVETEAEPLTEVVAVAPAEGAIPPGNAQESQPSAAGAEAQDLSPVSPEEVYAAVFPDAASRVIFRRACLELGSQNATTRASSAKALGGVRHELSVRVLAAQVAHEHSPQVRQECIKALTTLEMKQGLPAVERALTDPAPSVRLTAVRGLYRLAGAKGAPALASMLSDSNEEVRRRAATCIGWQGGEEDVAALSPLLTDRSVSVRHAAIEAMANLRSLRPVPSLIECLSDPEDSIQRVALAALEAITGKKMIESFPAEAESRERLIARWRAWWSDGNLYSRSTSTAEGR